MQMEKYLFIAFFLTCLQLQNDDLIIKARITGIDHERLRYAGIYWIYRPFGALVDSNNIARLKIPKKHLKIDSLTLRATRLGYKDFDTIVNYNHTIDTINLNIILKPNLE